MGVTAHSQEVAICLIYLLGLQLRMLHHVATISKRPADPASDIWCLRQDRRGVSQPEFPVADIHCSTCELTQRGTELPFMIRASTAAVRFEAALCA